MRNFESRRGSGGTTRKTVFSSAVVTGNTLIVLLAAFTLLFTITRTRLQRSGYGFTGDEPHYLLITHSLVKDMDLDLGNQYLLGDDKRFHPALDHHTTIVNGRELSIHHIGLPLLLAGPYAIMGQAGAAAAMIAIALTGLALMYRFLLLHDYPPWLAAAILAAAAGTAPFMIYGVEVFPAFPAAVLMALALQPQHTRRARIACLTIPVFLLPWLHLRFILLSLGILLSALARSDRKHFIPSCAGAFVLTILGNLGFYLAVHGHPLAGFGLHPTPHLQLDSLRAAIGLFLDQRFGLLPFNPILWLLPAGLALTHRRHPGLPGHLLLLSGPYLLLIIAFPEWWGGWCPPGRYLAPLLPLFL
ncbi:hypothetical protein JW905_00880, partial [bacterium]|nr:hypothetical protein [candidate division CSSED10-310 bacterium]